MKRLPTRRYFQDCFLGVGMLLAFSVTLNVSLGADKSSSPSKESISYYQQIRPIFQAHCQGCHQPAKAGGEYVMTVFAQLVQGGESGEAAIVPGQPDASHLMEEITPHDGEAEMPQGKPPLAKEQIELIRRWIAEGAHDDTPDNARERYSQDHPPVYTRLPVITSLDYSPDGSLLAVAGFHEILLHKADGSGLVGRLIGMSERVESLAFSPDGKRLAASAGDPGRMGEIQIWNVADQELELSIPLTFDTVYGVSWSPDGKIVAVGCSDNIVRGFDSESGEQVFFNGAHNDWPLGTVFSVDGSHLVSIGRDMTTKLYKVDTERFIDNVTSITPGALKGGIIALARHPERDEVLVGGSDGTPRIYRMHRVTKRVIGDDANLIRKFPKMRGRVYGAVYAPDGKTIACGSALDGQGQVMICSAEFDSKMPGDIRKIVEKVVTQQSAEEKKRLEEWITSDVKVLQTIEIPSSVFAIAYSPQGTTIAVAGADGTVRLINPQDGTIIKSFEPVKVSSEDLADGNRLASMNLEEIPEDIDADATKEPLPEEGELAAITITPFRVDLHGPGAYAQIEIKGLFSENGELIDVTRMADISIEQGSDIASVTKTGRILARSDGEAVLKATLRDQTARIKVIVTGQAESQPVSFIKNVNPVLSRLGCNAGTCHGAKDGKNGFKLSLRGYDPIVDARSFTDDLKSRRTNIASPDDSLMLLKATGAVPHVGGQLTTPGHPYYQTIRRWIAEGARLDLDVPRVEAIAVKPENPIIELIGGRQQFQVYARYSNGQIRDVTREAFLTSGDTEVAEINRAGIATGIRRGESPIMARFEGKYAATTLTVMGNRSGFYGVWQQPEEWSPIDGFVAEKWKRMKIVPSELCTDEQFVRRVFLDLTGLPPSPEQLRAFLDDSRPTREKRDALIDELVGSEAYIDYWTNKWADLLQVNRKFLGAQGAKQFRLWIREKIAGNTPYDQFCREILTASGSNKENPPASYFKILRDPSVMMENTTHLFLAVRFNCNKCHDHPFERWSQDQYYETAAFFAQTALKRDPKNAKGNIGGTAVEGAKPLWEVVYTKDSGEITHERTGVVTAPRVPYDREIELDPKLSRREQLAAWITSPENDYFAKSYVNRVWGYLMGVGLIEPLDDIRAGNPPTNPRLLEWLTEHFIASGFDVQDLMRTICKSRVYQLSIATNSWNEDDQRNYSHAIPKRLPAEVLYDTIYTVTGAKMQIPGVPAGTRAAALPDVGVKLPDGFLANLGRPVRESACECERSSDLQLGPVMALMNGATVSQAISQPGNAIAKLVAAEPDDEKMINALFVRILNRQARAEEIAATMELFSDLKSEHAALVSELAAYREEIAPRIAEREARRQSEIAAAQKAYDARNESLRPAREKAEQERQQKIAKAQAAIDQRRQALAKTLPEWEKTASQADIPWTVLKPENLKASTGAKLSVEEDLSVFASGPNNRQGNYTLTAKTDLEKVTGIKLEVLADERLPSKGPGRPPNGNFVLNEFTVHVWPVGKPNEKKKLVLQNARADFSQKGYEVAQAIDGKASPGSKGWATHPRTGENRVATFELKEPLSGTGPYVLHFQLDQQYPGRNHTIGRFRISVTTSPPPLNLSVPPEILEIVAIPAADRTDEQKDKLLQYLYDSDEALKKQEQALAEAQKPLPEDPELVRLRKRLELVSRPLPKDPKLARLERAVQLSEQQLKNERLTVAQDLAWALINSPAFLFNR